MSEATFSLPPCACVTRATKLLLLQLDFKLLAMPLHTHS